MINSVTASDSEPPSRTGTGSRSPARQPHCQAEAAAAVTVLSNVTVSESHPSPASAQSRAPSLTPGHHGIGNTQAPPLSALITVTGLTSSGSGFRGEDLSTSKLSSEPEPGFNRRKSVPAVTVTRAVTLSGPWYVQGSMRFGTFPGTNLQGSNLYFCTLLVENEICTYWYRET